MILLSRHFHGVSERLVPRTVALVTYMYSEETREKSLAFPNEYL